MPSSALRQIVAWAKASGVFRPRDLDQRQIARQYLRIAEQQGLIVRVGRGLYSSPDVAATEFHSFARARRSNVFTLWWNFRAFRPRRLPVTKETERCGGGKIREDGS